MNDDRIDGGAGRRRLLTAVLLAVGTELTVGETRDTNSGELARSLTREGVTVLRAEALRDRLDEVVAAIRRALESADLVVTTGGLGPTPDDLTREAIATACGERPEVDVDLAEWLRSLFARRGLAFPEANLKQAWLIPSARAIPNERGTAPGWLVDAPGDAAIVALPGPPAEMRGMWEKALSTLRGRGLGERIASTTLRLGGIGESHVATLLGDLLHAPNPIVATYARADAVDVRIGARAEGGRTAEEILAEAEAAVSRLVGRYVWGRDEETWPDALGRRLAARGWDVAIAEAGTGGSLLRLFGEAAWLRGGVLAGPSGAEAAQATPVRELAEEARRTGATIGLAVEADQTGPDTIVALAAAGPWGLAEDRRTAFLNGAEGRRRAAISAALFLFALLRDAPVETEPETQKASDTGPVSTENERVPDDSAPRRREENR